MKIELKLRAIVSEKDGVKKLEFKNPRYYRYMLNRLNLKENVIVTIENQKSQRSGQQNRYWHGICFPIIGELTGYTSEEAKAVCKKLFLLPKIVTVKGIDIEIERKTSEISISEGVEFTEKIMKLAGDLGGEIKTPCEMGYFCGRMECSVCSQ